MTLHISPALSEELPTDDQELVLVYGVVVLLPVMTVVVFLRIYARQLKFVVRRMGLDDWLILCCWVMANPCPTCSLIELVRANAYSHSSYAQRRVSVYA